MLRNTSDRDCLSAIAADGRLPEGCDPERYIRLGYITLDGLYWRLTTLGSAVLAGLASRTSKPLQATVAKRA